MRLGLGLGSGIGPDEKGAGWPLQRSLRSS